MAGWKDSYGNRYDSGGRRIEVLGELTGKRFAIRKGSSLFVSPAMWKLIADTENPDDHFALLDQIPYRIMSARGPKPER